MDLEQQLTDVLGRRAGALTPGGPDDLADVRLRARSIRRRRAAGTSVGVAALVAAVVVPISLWGGGRGQAERPPFATQSPSASADCSAYGVARPEQPAGLPPAVADTWQQLVDAAAMCDFDALEAVGKQATISYGLPLGAEDLRQKERAGEGRMGLLLKVLALSHARLEQGEPAFVWPAIHAHAADGWAHVTEADRAELRAIHTPEEIASFDEFESYYGWRVGIAEDGTWQYFVAGD